MPALALADGRTLVYGEAGAGPTLVLVHGSPADGRAWSRVAKHLTARFRVLTPDLPGAGASSPLPDGAAAAGRTAALGDAVAALLAAQAAPVLLAGHSYGGNVALHAAIARPEKVRALALFEPAFFRALALVGETRGHGEAHGYFRAYVARVGAGEADAVRAMIDFWFGPAAYPRLPESVRAYLAAAAPRNALDITATFAETVSAAALAAFAWPVALVHGGASPPASGAIVAALARLVPGARIETVPGAMHGMLDTHAEAVAAILGGLG
jgi:pimeloyl-ACP methyl ester carboxylesterase